MKKLRTILDRIDGKGYKAYKDLKGRYRFPQYQLTVDHVQGDPYAAPSRVSIAVSAPHARFPDELWATPVRKTALEDYLARALANAIRKHVKGHRGLGKSGEVGISINGQHVLVRNAVRVSNQNVEARLTVGLPARGRTIMAREAVAIFFDELPQVAAAGLLFDNLDRESLYAHVESIEDEDALRAWLEEQNLVAFVGNGARLARRSGIDDRPLDKGCVTFETPPERSTSVELPNTGPISGMGIPKGVTLIVGGGFHGKSTLLHALERGVYNHIPGDGRERVVTEPTAVKIRAEDGRVVNNTNISAFIDNLPLGKNTHDFSTENASGSTSQAANIVEALESGARTLLIDEDTSATNFMIRDERMQALVAEEKEPITPLLHRVRELYLDHNISTIIVMGGSGDYFSVADTVIMMDAYAPHDVTTRAQRIASQQPIRAPDGGNRKPFETTLKPPPPKWAFDASRGKREVKIDARETRALVFGTREIDIARVEQLIDVGQTRSIGLIMLYYATHYLDKDATLIEGLKHAMRDVGTQGLDVLSPYKVGNLSLPRLYEVLAAMNRLRY